MKQLTKKVVRDIIIARRECGDFCDGGAEEGLAFLESCGNVITAGDIARAYKADLLVCKLLAALDDGYVLSGDRFAVEYVCAWVPDIDNITLVVEETVHGGYFKLSDGNVQMTLARGARLRVTSFGGSLTVNGVTVTERGVHDSFTVVNDGKGVSRED